MNYHIEYIPQTHDRTKHSKGNGGQVGSGVHHIPKPDPVTGLMLYHGNGCQSWADCFTCPFPANKCRYGNGTNGGKQY